MWSKPLLFESLEFIYNKSNAALEVFHEILTFAIKIMNQTLFQLQ